jgi:cytochrome P450
MTPTTRIKLMSEALAADPWPELAALRAQGPFVWHEALNRWLVTTDREVREVTTNYRRFTVEETSMVEVFGEGAFIAIDDRKRHDSFRSIWAEAFRLPAMDVLRPRIRAITSELISPLAERLRSGEAVDIGAALCRPLPTLVISAMMGAPDALMPDIVRWSDAMAAGGPVYLIDQAATEAREAAKADLADCLKEQIAWRRREPGPDLISAMVHAQAAQGLPEEHLVQNARQLLFAGNETTARWLSNIFVAYGEHPDCRRQLAANRELTPAANDEVMRWQGVVGVLTRKLRGGPMRIDGVEMRDGDLLTCLPHAANRDPARYERADAFDVHRPPQPNLGFGVGLHHCLGVNLAKVEAQIAVDAVLELAPDFELAAPYSYSTLPMRGAEPVVISATPRRRRRPAASA